MYDTSTLLYESSDALAVCFGAKTERAMHVSDTFGADQAHGRFLPQAQDCLSCRSWLQLTVRLSERETSVRQNGGSSQLPESSIASAELHGQPPARKHWEETAVLLPAQESSRGRPAGDGAGERASSRLESLQR